MIYPVILQSLLDYIYNIECESCGTKTFRYVCEQQYIDADFAIRNMSPDEFIVNFEDATATIGGYRICENCYCNDDCGSCMENYMYDREFAK